MRVSWELESNLFSSECACGSCLLWCGTGAVCFVYLSLLASSWIMSTKTYLEALDECARLYPDRPLFWIPQNSEPGKPVSEWSPLTFAQFYADVCAAKEFYAKNLSHLDKGSVIGLW